MKENCTDKSNDLQKEMKKNIVICAFRCVIIAALIITLIFVNKKMNTNTGISYKENSDIDYKVYLKENEFYNEKFVL